MTERCNDAVKPSCRDCQAGACPHPQLCQEERDDYARKYGVQSATAPTGQRAVAEEPVNWNTYRAAVSEPAVVELLKLSKAATPGPWKASDRAGDAWYVMGPDLVDKRQNIFVALWPVHPPEETKAAEIVTEANAQFVATLVNWFRAYAATLPQQPAVPEDAVQRVAEMLALSPLIEAPKLSWQSWMGLARSILDLSAAPKQEGKEEST